MKNCCIYIIFIVLLIITLFSLINNYYDIKRQQVTVKTMEYCINNNHLNVAVVIEPLYTTDLYRIGGTGHWFHLLERVINILHLAKINVWEYNENNDHDRDLYIIFHEKESVKQLNPFGRFILTSLLSGNKYQRVIFGYSNDIRTIYSNSNNNINTKYTLIETKSFSKSFVIDLKKISKNRFIISDDDDSNNNNNNGHDICFQLLLKVPLHRIQSRFNDWFENISSFHLFRNISFQICNIKYEDNISSNEKIIWKNSNNNTLDDISKISMTFLKSKIKKKLKKMNDTKLISSPIVYNTQKNILIYQRDKSRVMSLINTKICNKDNNDADIVNCISKLLSNNREWNIKYLKHSDNRSPCELVQEVSTSTVLVTPHGFQSILLLFQPLSSLLVEIYPFMYYKPDLYGFIQAGLRQRLSIARSYLGEETLPFHLLHYMIKSIQQTFGLSYKFCINNLFCKILVRNENTYITEDFINRLTMFINDHYP